MPQDGVGFARVGLFDLEGGEASDELVIRRRLLENRSESRLGETTVTGPGRHCLASLCYRHNEASAKGAPDVFIVETAKLDSRMR